MACKPTALWPLVFLFSSSISHAQDGGLAEPTITAVSVVGLQDRYVLNLEVNNPTGSDLGLAVQSQMNGPHAYLRDGNGGECPAPRSGMGTIGAASGRDYALERERNYTTVSAGTRSRQTLFFRRHDCSPALTDPSSLTATIQMLVWGEDGPRLLSLTFDNISFVRR